MTRLHRSTALLVGAALVLTACADKKNHSTPQASSSSTTAPPVAVPAVSVDAIDYGYSVSGTATAGVTKITFTNKGQDFHMMGVARLKDGKTVQDFLAALKTDDEADDAAVQADPDETVDGLPSVLTPGASSTTYATLQTGTYALVCFFPGKDDGQPHFLKGMVNALTVTASTGTPVEPAAQAEVTTTDTKLTVPDLTSGKGTYKYTNSGTTTHSLIFVKLHDGKTFDEMVAWLDKYFQGQAKLDDRPGDVWGGVEATAKTAWFDLDLPPGKYLALDTESPDSAGDADGKEFFRDAQGGLRAEFTVA
jgi:hypothetical protein